MSTKKTFKPTAAQIVAAKNYFVARAFSEMAETAIKEIELGLMAEQAFYADAGHGGGRLRTIEDSWFLDGLDEYCKVEPCTPEADALAEAGNQAAKYYAEFRKKALAAGFINGENSACMASNELMKFEHAFFNACFDIHGLTLDQALGSFTNYRKMLELLAGLFAGSVEKVDLDAAKKEYYNARMAEKVKQ